MRRNIHLHGDLARQFAPVYQLDVASAGEAGQALAAVVPGFRQYAVDRNFRVLRGDPETGMALGPDDLDFHLGHADLHIVPVIAGAGNRGLGKIIAGVFLIGAAFMFPGAITGIGIGGSTIGGAMKGLGVALAMGGLGQMLSPAPKISSDSGEDQSSYLFSGGANVTTEGGPVPLVYGQKFRVKPVLIAAGLSTEDVAI
ncbi:tail assembly protein [Martelella lutilitoris]|uniref:Tail assembly protein n=1 Tax=Martelella lutilitoris TaxID=2583532 RepID=A0A5C4JNC1_9HYPH|nr:tail assembly protein [Martelella lutilitoris]TNB46800.1 tail assembly protein [Martelella lutilitoris]